MGRTKSQIEMVPKHWGEGAKPKHGEAVALLSDADPGTKEGRLYRDLTPRARGEYDAYVKRWTDYQANDPFLSQHDMGDVMPERIQYYFTLLNEQYGGQVLSPKLNTRNDPTPDPELDPHLMGAGKNRGDLARGGRARDVHVLGGQAQESVPDRSAHRVGLMPTGAQSGDHRQRSSR